MSRHVSHLPAIGFALAGFTCWVIGDMFMKLSGELGVPKYQVMSIAGLGGLFSISLLAALRGEIKNLRPRKPLLLITLGLMFAFNYVMWLIALAHLPLANFYTILFLAPTVTAIFAVLFLGEQLNLKKIAAIIAGFAGVVIAVNPRHLFESRDDWLSYAACFVGMFIVVAQMLTLRFAGAHESRECTAFYPRIAAIAVGLIGVLIWGFEPMNGKSLACALATGAVGGIGWMLMAQAYKMAPAATIAPFHYSQIISAAFFGYLIWHDVPSAHLLTGAPIIIGSGLYIAAHARKVERITEILAETP